MADPTTTTRSAPGGIRLEEGHPIKVAFASDPDICFEEVATTPPELDGGEPIDTTTAFRTVWRTKSPQTLVTLSPFQVRVAYDPLVYTQVRAIINVNNSITVRFPDGSTLDFWGYLQKFTPQETKEGNRPEATVVIVPTNWDSSNNVEAGPAYTDAAGT